MYHGFFFLSIQLCFPTFVLFCLNIIFLLYILNDSVLNTNCYLIEYFFLLYTFYLIVLIVLKKTHLMIDSFNIFYVCYYNISKLCSYRNICMYQEHWSIKKNNSKLSLSHIFMQNWHIILEWFYMLISMFLSDCTDYIDI